MNKKSLGFIVIGLLAFLVVACVHQEVSPPDGDPEETDEDPQPEPDKPQPDSGEEKTKPEAALDTELEIQPAEEEVKFTLRVVNQGENKKELFFPEQKRMKISAEGVEGHRWEKEVMPEENHGQDKKIALETGESWEVTATWQISETKNEAYRVKAQVASEKELTATGAIKEWP